MPKLTEMPILTKIKTLDEIEGVLQKLRQQELKIIQCHGVFDLLHPGHIRHFREARSKGDCLIVSVTPDRFVNKGPGRPVFTESLRLEAIAALADVDFVVLNDTPDAIAAIEKIRPNLYVKGIEYQNHAADLTGKISSEQKAVEAHGGAVFYTDDLVFSSSSLLNRYFDTIPPEVTQFLQQLRKSHSLADILDHIESLADLNVLIVGDAIIDEYQFVEPLGQSGKGLHMVARCLEKEVFLGGSLIIANHIAQFAKGVTLVTAVGKRCPYLNFIHHQLDPKVKPDFTFLEDAGTLVKKRYVLKDGKTLSKLFETYSGQEDFLTGEQTQSIVEGLRTVGSEYDLVVVCDFGNGFTNPQIIDAISDLPNFIALNTQTNSGNRGFNVVTNYRRANYISLNEPELRLAAHDKASGLEGIAVDIGQIMDCSILSITQGVKGVLCVTTGGESIQIPAFATNSIDRIGAGDSYLSLSALCLAKGCSPVLASFIGSVAAAMSVQVIGNQEPIKKIPLCKFITRLMK
jgi:rfaE bifunctional protein nucleotidyltransferase chain/domain